MMKYYVLTSHMKLRQNVEEVLHIALYIGTKEMSFFLLEEEINRYLEQFERTSMSETGDMELEELGDFLFEHLKEMLCSHDIELYQVELYYVPTRRYKVSSQLLLPFSEKELIRE